MGGGSTPPYVAVFIEGRTEPKYVTGEWIAPDDIPGTHVTFGTVDGFWEVVVPVDEVLGNQVLTVRFPRLPTGPFGWWHQMLGIKARSAKRGREMCIGVIDEGLPHQKEDSCIKDVKNDGAVAWSSAADPRAYDPKSDHGEKVCALIASRTKGVLGFDGIAPEAEVFFASAYSPYSDEPKLWGQNVGDCILYLAEQRRCDVISVSAGDLEEESPWIDTAVQFAADLGTVCFFAAGNSSQPKYPALQPDCHAVAAVGKSGEAPDSSRIQRIEEEDTVPLSVSGFYVWKYSARGPNIEFCAPGVGVIFNRRGQSAAAVVGTSFACPLAAGIAALILEKDNEYMEMERDRKRYDRAMMVLRGAARSLGNEVGGTPICRHGLLRL